MVDVHCHILPGVDDGPDSLEESLAMAESAIADGITHVVATPHSNSEYYFDYARILHLRDRLQTELGDRLKLATGCDFHLSPENLRALRLAPQPFCINQKDYLLVEFNEWAIPPSMDETLLELQCLGLRVVVTHPERNAILRQQPERLAQWVRQGCFVQVTGGSLTGDFGKQPMHAALAWIGQDLVHFVASDAHNTRGRPLRLEPAFNAVNKKFGEVQARALFIDNPMAAFEGRSLPYVPELKNQVKTRRRKRFLLF
jgi:protein-tyrosine phosphatase